MKISFISILMFVCAAVSAQVQTHSFSGMKYLKFVLLLLLQVSLLCAVTACKDDENGLAENQRLIPLNMEDERYANERTYFTLQQQEGILKFNEDSTAYMIYPDNPKSSGFQEILLPVRLPSTEIMLQALGSPYVFKDLNDQFVIFSGEVKGKEGDYYPIVLTEIKAVFMINFAK